MALVDDIERLGRAVETGKAMQPEAVRELMKLADGGLTERGATEEIDDWQGARARYQAVTTED
jgi:hypothetical protein